MAKNNPKIDQNDPQAKIIIEWEEFEKLCAIQATEIEIAEWFGCSVTVLNENCKNKYKLTFQETFKRKSAKGKASLRRVQFQTAMGIKEGGKYTTTPNPTMQIWLGKQHLNQRDKSEVENRNIDMNKTLTDKELTSIIKGLPEGEE